MAEEDEVDADRLAAFHNKIQSARSKMQKKISSLKVKHSAFVKEFSQGMVDEWQREQLDAFNKQEHVTKQSEGQTMNGEVELFQDSFARLDPEAWTCLRSNPQHCKFSADCGLSLDLSRGSLWEDTSAEFGAVSNIFLHDLEKYVDRCVAWEVSVRLNGGRLRGEQAGLLYYLNDDNYVKLVIETTKSLQTKILMAVQRDRKAEIIHRIPVSEKLLDGSLRLRLEFSQDLTQLVGIFHNAYCQQLIGKADVTQFPTAVDSKRYLAITAHGSSNDNQSVALFSNFQVLQLASNRICWSGSQSKQVAVASKVTQHVVSDVSNWTFSDSLSEDKLAQIQSLIATNNVDAAITATEPATVWTFSSDLSEKDMAEVRSLLAANNISTSNT